MKKLLHDIVRERRLVCDGAMGTQLMAAGLELGGCGEHWNLTHSERVLAIQKEYVDAGADCLITNTFGGSRTMLTRHGHGDEVRAINQASVRIAREAFSNKVGYVLGDVGPLGAILEPYGDMSQAEARSAYEEQCAALVEAGVDAIMIETQTSLDEIGIAIDAAKAAGAPSIIASLAYDLSADKSFYVTMMGVLPGQAAEFIQERGAHIVALNCGTGVDMAAAVKVVQLYRESCNLPTMGQPNAGLPVLEGGKAVYKQLPEEMAASVTDLLEAGGNIVGSCCGSTPAHTRAIRKMVDQFNATHQQKSASLVK
ncbi:MAG: homocysteine S-methyltransferase family protein [Ignavibacteriae bacterium]|nr:homocysteine S-methyltransferase family protein [Ignavibacteriota bacterium]